MKRIALMGHLARFNSFHAQGEPLCTQGLAYVLDGYPEARSALAKIAEDATGFRIGADLRWQAEVVQGDRARPDLEACTVAGTPVVKVEAKLGAPLDSSQVQSYAADLAGRAGQGLLIILVPARRVSEAAMLTAAALGLPGLGPWPKSKESSLAVAVLSWDDLFIALQRAATSSCAHDLEQLEAMYRVLIGDDIEPLAGPEELLNWRGRATDLLNVIDRVTRDLTTEHSLYPIGRELPEQVVEGLDPFGYQRRYVCRPCRGQTLCFSVGLRDPFVGHVTPVWMRFHRDTPGLVFARGNLSKSSAPTVESGGHVWIPLEVPTQASKDEMVKALTLQVERIFALAIAP